MTQTVLKNEISELNPKTPPRAEQRRETAEHLSNVLADAFRVSLNLQGMHWNVEGPMFYSLHRLTEEQYREITASIDTIAERIRALGLAAPESLREFEQRSVIDDLPTDANLQARVERLVEDYERAVLRLTEVVKQAEQFDDVKTADLLTEQIGKYEENAWMLRATAA